MSWPKLLVFVRHGESTGNLLTAEEKAQQQLGSQDYPLSEFGRLQARYTGDYLSTEFPQGFDTVYESYYLRCKETRMQYRDYLRVKQDARLAEAQRGIWHSMTLEEVRDRYPQEAIRREREGIYHYRPIGGENWPDVEARIHSFIQTLRMDHAGKRVLVFGHGNWMTLFEKIVQGSTAEAALEEYKEKRGVDNASVTVYRSYGIWNRTFEREIRNHLPWKGKVIN